MARHDLPAIRIDTSVSNNTNSEPPQIVVEDSEKNLIPESAVSDRKASSGSTSTVCSMDSSFPATSPTEALKKALEMEPDGLLDNKPFKLSPKQLSLLHDVNGLFILQEIGGMEGLEEKLSTSAEYGLSVDDPNFEAREQVYSKNVLPDRKSKSLFHFVLLALSDKMLILLTIAAIISLALGLYQTFGTAVQYDRQGNKLPKVDWVEGVAILVAVVVVVFAGGINDWQKEIQFAKLNKKKDDREVKVIRSGKVINISVFDVDVGDVMLIEPGDMVPVDGVLITGNGVRCDESAATGESDSLKKIAAKDALDILKNSDGNIDLHKSSPFVLSGSKALEGFGHFLVTAVGPNSAHGRTMMDLRSDDGQEATPLQAKLNVIAEEIAKWGGGSSLLLFFVLLIRFLAELPSNHATSTEKAQTFVQYLTTSVALIAVAVPEGLPLAVTLALAFATKRMLKYNNLVRVLKSCETMGNATTICSDKTGTLTQNKMTVVAGTIGPELDFSSLADQMEYTRINEVSSHIPESVRSLLITSIALNSTAFEDASSDEVFVGSKTEVALLNFARLYLAMGPLDTERSNAKIVQMFPFDSSKKCMGVVLQIPGEQAIYRLLIKGASEIILEYSDSITTLDSNVSRDDIQTAPLNDSGKENITRRITAYAERSLRTIGIAYRDFDSWPPPQMKLQEDDNTKLANFADVLSSFKWIGLFGIMDPLRPSVIDAVADCKQAGVFVRMVTGDNLVTAKAIATECGIYTPGGVVMQGPDFRNMDPKERDAIIPKLQVLARSSPQDKRLLVSRLKHMGETVAVTGDGTNDAPALTMADVGFAMGIAGTEVAKEASDIILMDDNFTSIVNALLWGRAVNDAVKKFLQMQLTINITAVLLTFISAVASSNGDSVLTAVQLLWVNLIMDTFAALALATDSPTRTLLDRKPSKKSDGLISVTMWKMIIGQAIYQVVVTFVLHFAGDKIWGYTTDRQLEQLDSTVFNTFVWMQVFNLFVCRRLDNKNNIFEGVSKNYFFIAIAFIMIGGQTLIMFVGGTAFSIVRLSGSEWAVSLIIGALVVPWSVFLRLCIPDSFAVAVYRPVGKVAKFLSSYIVRFFSLFWPSKKKNIPKIVEEGDSDYELHTPGGTFTGYSAANYDWNQGIEKVRDELIVLKRIRGGRINVFNFKPKQVYQNWRSRSNSSVGVQSDTATLSSPYPTEYSRSRSGSSIGALAMVPSIVGGAVAGWSPIERSSTPAQTANHVKTTSDGYLSP
ncbi:hypothetical protein V1511DRAFT_487094 [Dipodascopsis uninucleata]